MRLFPCFFTMKGILCILVASYGHVSLIIDQLDWQRCRSPLSHCCGVVVGWLVSRESWKQTSSILSSDRFTQTSQYSYSCRTQWDPGATRNGDPWLAPRFPARCESCETIFWVSFNFFVLFVVKNTFLRLFILFVKLFLFYLLLFRPFFLLLLFSIVFFRKR